MMITQPLSERLPQAYDRNQAEMTADQREAIEEDRQRWNRARVMIRDMAPAAIRLWLDQQDGEYRADMARRLNIKRNRRMK